MLFSHDSPKIMDSDWALIALLMNTLFMNTKSGSSHEYDYSLPALSGEDYDGDDDDSDNDNSHVSF